MRLDETGGGSGEVARANVSVVRFFIVWTGGFEILHDAANESCHVTVIQNGVTFAVFLYNLIAERMESANLHLLAANAILQLSHDFAGEGNEENVGGVDMAVSDEVVDLREESGGLARAGGGEDQLSIFAGDDSSNLVRVEFISLDFIFLFASLAEEFLV